MSSTVIADPIAEAVSALAIGVDAVCAMPIARADAVGQAAAYERVEELRRRLEFAHLGMLSEMQNAGTAAAFGAPSMVALLQGQLRLSAADAAARVRAAEALCEDRALTGERIPARLPAVAENAERGIIGAEHIRAILRTMDALPADTDPEILRLAEATMVRHAAEFDPRALGRIGTHLAHRICPKDPKPEDIDRRRGLAFFDELPGMTAIRGLCSDATAAIIRTALDPLSKPRPEADGIRGERTGAQRAVDALEELASTALSAGDLPSQGGELPQVTMLLQPGQTTAELPWVGPVPLEQLNWMLCDSTVTPIELDANGVPHRIGTPTRTVPAWLRKTVIARDRGCSFPGCDRPHTWSDIHHVTEWQDDGPHQRDNLTVLCGHHHKVVHQHRWRIVFIDGIPHYVPPRWIDPQQRPRRNRLHHLSRNLPLRT